MGPLLTELAEQSRPVLRNGSDPIEGHTTRPMFAIQSSKPNQRFRIINSRPGSSFDFIESEIWSCKTGLALQLELGIDT